MDKNKGRTDLLAAGRKKFQQYRQKKDSKGSGSHLKSSKKSGKSEQHDGDGDADVPSAAAEPMESLQIQERELGPEILDSNVGHVDLSLLRPFDDYVAPDSVLPTVNPLSVPGQLEALGGEMGDACNSRFPIEGSDIEEARSNSSVGNDDSYSLVLNEQKSHMTIEPDMVRVTALGTCEVAVTEGESMYATGTLPVDFSAARSEQDISDALLIQAREDQEADCSGSKQLDRISGVELQGDETPAVSEFSEGAEILSGVVAGASIMESTCDVEQPCASTIVGNESEDLSVTMAMPTDGVSDVGPEMADQWRENLVVSSSNEKESGVYYGCDDSRSYMGVAIQARTKRADYEGYIPDNFPDGFYESKGERCSKTLGTKMVITSGGSSATSREDVSTISLLQLAEVLNGLDEDEFRFLLKSKDSAPNASLGDTGSFLVPEYDFSDVLETYKEQLYLTNITKDIFALELMEHSKLQKVFDHQRQQLDDKISMLSALLNEASDTNKCLAEELAQSRSELQAVTSGRKELKHEFQTATAEIVEFSARVLVLENELERSRRDFSGLSLELTDCKSVVDALRVENSNLSGSLTLAMEERRNLEEEVAKCKGLVADVQVANGELSGSLAFVTDERKKLGDTKAYFVCENEKLLSQLADCKSLVEAVEVEKASVCGTLALMTEEMKKLEEGKHHFVCENDRLRSELAECQSLVKTIQVENANLTEGLSLVTDERRKLEEEKENLSGENKGLSSELRVHQELLSVSQAENLQLNTDLREMNLWFEQLLEENIFLNSSLDVHKAKIREINHMQIQFAFHSRESSNRIESPDLPRSHINITNDKDFPQISGKQDGEIFSSLLEGKPLSDGYAGTAPKQLEQNVYSGASGIPDFNGHLEEADKVIQKLEMAIEEMHSHSASLSRSGGKVAASGVSKLIQAFESKTHLEDGEVEENLMTGDRSIADPFMLSKLQTVNLRTVLKELQLDVVKASEIFKGERNGREVANIAYTELKVQYEAIREYTENLEAMNIELEVQCEAVKQHVCNDEEKKRELVVLYESLQQENINLKAENTELGKKLNDFFVRINELHSQLGELQQSSEEISSSICNQIENLRNEAADKLEAARTDHEAICNSYKEVNEKLNDLREKKELAFGILNKIYGRLRKLTIDSSVYVEESELNIQNDEFLDPLDTRKYEDLMEQLGTFLGERPHLQCENNKLNTELVSRTNEMVELNRRCLDLNVVLKLVEDVEAFVKSEDLKIDFDNPPISRLDSFVRFLLQRYIEADERVNLAREELGLKVIEFSEQQKKINQLDSLNLTQKNEIVNLKESLSKAEEAIVAVRSELQEKTVEVEQSEQRVSSVREKLSIAVAKGKGLIVQRDNLKQSLQETSLELERSSHELQLKDARLHELEEKLKMYSEAGERVEALESELSYIRNSATALRESFLLKDSVLQRIEEILEDLELPESFHTRDIIEKVDWLARSVTGNSLPPNDWDQKSSVEGGSYSDAGFVVMDGWKEDMQPNSNPGDDLRRNYEELQGKIYELAEQNEMLEQSLMERNNLVQRWEEVLERINMPTRLRSMETEVRIEWLGSELSEAHQYAKALQQKIDNLENHCGTLAADLEESQRRLSDVEAAFQVVTHDKESLSKSLETLTFDHEKLSEQAVQFEHANDKLQNELTDLQEKMDEKHYQEEQVDRIEGEIIRLQDLVSDALQDPATKDLVSGGSSIECLEGLLRKLVDNYTSLCLEKSMHRAAVDAPVTEKVDATLDDVRNREIFDAEKPDVLFLKKELEEDLRNLTRLKEEGDIYREKHQSLACEVEALNKKMEELQELLSQEEKKSASARDKLNVAVRKGKSLVQQRDSLKQAIEERNNEVESLKSVISQQENYIAQYEQKIKDLSTYPERVASLESENFSLSNHLIETEHRLQEKGHTLVLILNTLGEIDVGGEYSHSDPIVKLEQLGKLCSELHTGVASSEQESRKCKRAAELLLEELNEVQERNDSLQEELAKAGSELLALSKERDMAQAAKLEAFSRLENLSSAHSEVKKIEHADFMALKSVVHQLRGSFFDVNNLLADVLLKDLEILHNLEANMELCLKSSGATNAVGLPLVNTHGGVSSYLEFKEKFLARDFGSDIKRQEYYDDRDGVEVCRDVGHDLQGFSTEMSALKEKIQKHSFSLDEKAGKLSTVLETIRGELTSQAESFEALNKYIVSFESLEKEKDTENVILRKNIFLLYEACANSIMEIENRKASLFGNSFPAGGVGMELKSAAAANGEQLFGGRVLLSSEEQIRTMADGLLMLVKELASMEAEIIEGRQKEMKTTIANLQKELQEKDIQKDKICMELVSQIREAEAAATSYSVHFQSAKTQVHDLQKRMEVVEEERISLERRVKELQDREATSIELQEKVRSMTEMVAAKDQEIESLMQALDEEEMQMEELANKISELEKVGHQKNIDLENLEASRGKAMKKLSITVNKFDELHNLSASLLSEVEKLQSQLQDRDSEISFLRQEVTRSTNDVLIASQMSNKNNSDEIHAFLIWLDTMFSRVQVHDVYLDDLKGSQIHELKEILQKQITSIISELEDLRIMAQTKDTLIQIERSRVEELTRKGDIMENSLRQKETQLNILNSARDSVEKTSTTPEIVEVEPEINKWTVPGTSIASKLRSLRKVNNDQVAIDMDPTSSIRLEDEDDDKVHGFKSLTTSRIVPRFTRPVTDMIDGLWVSCDRALMRQPALRLGIIIYWAVLHALFATFAV